MKQQITIKRLTASDLTLFEWHFRHGSAGNQKAINLDADVFVQKLYPNLNVLSALHDGRFGVDLYIYGPNGAGELNLQRKVIKKTSYKNWRLGGEMIGNPIGEETRFNQLATGDLAVIEFTGADFPVSAKMVLVAAGTPRDSAVHAALATFPGSMAKVTVAELQKALQPVPGTDEHPIQHLLLAAAALEDAALGGAEGVNRLFSKRRARRVSRQELSEARLRASDIGYRGETMVQRYLEQQFTAGQLTSFTWVSGHNAVAPYDFEVTLCNGDREWIDVKATAGEFERTLHVSLAELQVMAEDNIPYRLFRIYDMDESSATLVVSEPLREFAQQLIASFYRTHGPAPPLKSNGGLRDKYRASSC
jgi:hypothetical protein